MVGITLLILVVDAPDGGRNLISSEWQRTKKRGAPRHGERKEVKALIIYHCRGREGRHFGFLLLKHLL